MPHCALPSKLDGLFSLMSAGLRLVCLSPPLWLNHGHRCLITRPGVGRHFLPLPSLQLVIPPSTSYLNTCPQPMGKTAQASWLSLFHRPLSWEVGGASGKRPARNSVFLTGFASLPIPVFGAERGWRKHYVCFQRSART